MTIVKMKRLKLLALAADRDELLQRLLSAGCVEVTEPDVELTDPEWNTLVARDSALLGQVKGKAASVVSALDALKKHAPAKSGLFIVRGDIMAQDFYSADARGQALEKAAEINDYNRQISQLLSQENRLTSTKLGLTPWLSLPVDLSLGGTQFTRIIFGACPVNMDIGQITEALAAAAPTCYCQVASSDREQHYLLVVVHKSEEDQALAALRHFAFNPQSFRDMEGSAADNIALLEEQLAELAKKRAEVGEKIAAEAKWRKDLQICVDQMDQEIAKEEARGRLLTTGSLLYLKGWVPKPDVDRLDKELAGLDCAYELTDPTEEDIPPTLLRNSHLIHSMEMVTEMYSLPAYSGIDPNPLIFPFYTIFFGMMFADIAYGLILIIVSQIVIRKYHPKGTFGNIMQLGTILGFTSMVWGFLSGSFFGDAYTVFMDTFMGKPDMQFINPIIRPMGDPMSVLVLAICMGVVQLLTGQCIRIYLGFRDKEPWEGILDVVPWWIVFAGIAMLVLGNGPYVILAGVLALICTQGRHRKGMVGKVMGGVASLYDVTSWLGDVLSYTRLMALMLAGGVIASVMNILGSLAGKLLVFAIVFVIGHVFNMGINIIGTYVHAARLQYLEFFSKFYKEGGIPFKPLFCDTKYVNVIKRKEVRQNG